jgi:VWFA-related protein
MKGAALPLACLLAALPAAGQSAEAALRIVSPEDGTFVSGIVTLRAVFEPAAAGAVRVAFLADGKPVCSVETPPFECEWDSGEGVGAHVIRAVGLLRDGSRLVASARTKSARFLAGIDVGVVQVTATVLDDDGRFVKGLQADSFRVYEDGVPQPLSHFIPPGGAQELVSAIDISSSMADAMVRLRQAVRAFLSALKAEDKVTVLAFNDSIFTLARREMDPAARLRAVDRLAPWGGTSLYDVVLRGMDLLSRQKGRKALVVFSDGEDQNSHATVQDVERRAEINDAPIYMIGQGRGTKDKTLREIIDRLAQVSGGRAFHTDKIDALEGAFAEIAEELSNQYLLAYDPTNPARDGTWRNIKVELAGARHKVRARQGYRAVAGRR